MKIERLTKKYGEKVVLDDLSLTVARGETLCVLGRSGAGKTTLLNSIAGLCEFEGRIEGAESVSYVFQTSRLVPWLTVRENLRFAGGRCELIDGFLQQAGILELAEQRVSRLSGGEARRVAIVRAFLSSAPVTLLDEQFIYLDSATKAEMIELFCKLQKQEEKAVVFVTHDLDEAIAMGNRAAVLRGGKICFETALGGETPREYGAESAAREALMRELKM